MCEVSHRYGTIHICDACGNEFDPPADVCPRCGGASSAGGSADWHPDRGSAGHVRTYLPTDTDRFYHAAIVLTIGYAASTILGLLTANTSLFVFSLVLAIRSTVSMYLDLFGLETRLYDTRPILCVVGAILMYFLVVPIYIYKRDRHERSPVE